MREHSEERHDREWEELYQRMKVILHRYGKDAVSGGDYYLVDQQYGAYTHQVEVHKLHKLHMLQPEVIQALHESLAGYPDWELEISVSIQESGLIIDPGEGLTLSEDEIIDALDRMLLPADYRDLAYEGSRPSKRPDDILLAALLKPSKG